MNDADYFRDKLFNAIGPAPVPKPSLEEIGEGLKGDSVLTIPLSPETLQANWWKQLEDNWGDLYGIFCRFLPMYEPVWKCEAIAKLCGISMTQPITVDGALLRAKEDRNHEAMHAFLFAAWERAPDRPSIHSIPGWDVLCDLCSEFP